MIKQKQIFNQNTNSIFQVNHNQFLTQITFKSHQIRSATEQLAQCSEASFGNKEKTGKRLSTGKESQLSNFGVKNLKNTVVKQKFKNRTKLQENTINEISKIFISQAKESKDENVLPTSLKSFNNNLTARPELKNQPSLNNESLVTENKRLKGKVCLIINQFKQIQSRLNKQLSKRKGTMRKQAQSRAQSLDNPINQQILNAEQRCKIYKKQIEILKNRYNTFTQEKINLLTGELDKLKSEHKKCEAENKQLKRAIKQYESKMFRMGGIEDHKLIKNEIQTMTVENKKLKAKIKKDEQEQRMQHLAICNQKIKLKREQLKKQVQKEIDKIMKQEIKTKDQQIKELKHLNIKLMEDIKQLQNSILAHKTKFHIQQVQIKRLQDQNDQSIKHNQQFKAMLQQKQNTILDFHTKFSHFPLNPQISSKQTKDKEAQTQFLRQSSENGSMLSKKQRRQKQREIILLDEEERKKQMLLEIQDQNDNGETVNKKYEEQYSFKDQFQPKDQPLQNIFKQETIQTFIKKSPKYPIRLFLGEPHEESFKWNDFQFSSKIKEIQAMQHKNGHIKNLHFRYQKGEPLKNQSGSFTSFVCSQNEEYIKKIYFIFKNRILFGVKIQSSFLRKWSFGYVEEDNSERLDVLQVGTEQSQYPCCVFGQSINEGIVRIGCLVEHKDLND